MRLGTVRAGTGDPPPAAVQVDVSGIGTLTNPVIGATP